MSELLNIDANILNGKNVKSLVSMTYKFHNCNLNEYFDDIEKHYNNEELEYETYKEEFMLKYDELSSKEKYILQPVEKVQRKLGFFCNLWYNIKG